jgi:hypothetical protein
MTIVALRQSSFNNHGYQRLLYQGDVNNSPNTKKYYNKLSFSFGSLVEFIPHHYLWSGFKLLQTAVITGFSKGHKLFITY